MEENVNSPPTCKKCGVILKPGRKSFCSRQCNADYSNAKWLMSCENCKRQFILPMNRRTHFRKFKDVSKVFCSRLCFQKYWHDNCRIIRDNKKLNQKQDVQPNILRQQEESITTEEPESNPEVFTGYNELQPNNQ